MVGAVGSVGVDDDRAIGRHDGRLSREGVSQGDGVDGCGRGVRNRRVVGPGARNASTIAPIVVRAARVSAAWPLPRTNAALANSANGAATGPAWSATCRAAARESATGPRAGSGSRDSAGAMWWV